MSLRHDPIGLGEIIESGTGALTAGDDVVDEYAFQHIKLSEVCFGMIFSYFTIDIMDIYGPKDML
jgi:hypothetical protein